MNWVESIDALDAASYPELQAFAKEAKSHGFDVKASGGRAAVHAALLKVAAKYKKQTKSPKLSPKVDRSPKLEDAPKLDEVKPSAQVYKVWRREINEWRTEFTKHYPEKLLLINLMKFVPREIKIQLYAELPEGQLKLEKVLALMDRDFMGQALVQNRGLLLDYRQLRKSESETIAEFLTRYRQLRARALTANLITPSAADIHDLLQACDLKEEQHSSILRALKTEMRVDPEVDQLSFVLDELRTLEELQGLRGAVQEKAALLSEFSPSNGQGESYHGGGKGNGWGNGGRKDHGGGKGDVWTGGRSKGQGKGKGKGSGKGGKGRGKGAVRKDIAKSGSGGSWKKSVECFECGGPHFARECPNKKKGDGKGKGSGKSEEPGQKKDWKCKCGFLCFGRASFCPKCGERRA